MTHTSRIWDATSLRICIVTCSDTRSTASDTSGAFIQESLKEAGYLDISSEIVPDDPGIIREVILKLRTAGADILILSGGTGISPRDNTFDIVNSLIDKSLPGFGELFRMLSFEEIGSAAMLSRACAGLVGQTLIFSLPGSTPAVRLAMNRLIIPEIPHLASEIRRPA